MTKKLKNNKDGVISIIYVIGVFITVIIAMAFVNMTNKTMAINEMQGVMDVSGVIALRNSVDETAWRREELKIDKSKAVIEFRNLVNQRANEYVGNNKLLSGFKINNIRVYEGKETRMGNVQGVDQYYLESSATATYTTYNFIDMVVFHGIQFFDFLSTGEDSSIAVGGTAEDGSVEVVIRTVSRLAFR